MIRRFIKLFIKKKKWRRLNQNNRTRLMNDFNIQLVQVGRYTYGGLNVYTYNGHNKLTIGDYCSIAPNVAFLVSADHHTDTISSFPFYNNIMGSSNEAISKGDIIVDDDVWIGYGATILSGVHIHQGAVVAAGAVVSRDVPPYTIVGGAPARVIKYRFEQSVINFLLTLDYGKLDERLIQLYIDDLYKTIDGAELDEIKSLYSWFPKHK